jgi:hypothetical protein
MVITGEYVVKGLFHHCCQRWVVSPCYFFLAQSPPPFSVLMSLRGDNSMIIQMHGCTYIMDHQSHTHDPYEIQN